MNQAIYDDIIAIAGKNISEYPQACRYLIEMATANMKGPTHSKIEWIKWHRDQTGASLKEAKEKADKLFLD